MKNLGKVKRLLATGLSLMMVISCLPGNLVFAQEYEESEDAAEVIDADTDGDLVFAEDTVDTNGDIGAADVPYPWNSYKLQYIYTESDGKILLQISGADGECALTPPEGGYGWVSEKDRVSKITFQNISSIPEDTFKEYAELSTVTFNTSCDIGASAFEGSPKFYSVTFSYIDKSTNFSIGNSAFKGCSYFQSIDLSQSNLTAIGESSFEGTALYSVDLQKSAVTAIPAKAFKGITSLTSVKLPDGITSVGDYAFAGDTKLTTLNFKANTLSLGSHAFDGAGITKLEILGKNITVQEDTFAGLDMSKVSLTIASGSSLKSVCDANGWTYTENKVLTEEEIVVSNLSTAFPDEGFRKVVAAFDTSGDGKLDVYEIAEVKNLELTMGIGDITGIKNFTSLETLKVAKNNYITSANLKDMTSLKSVDFTSSDKLTTLNISGCSGLTSVKCSGTKVSELDLSAATNLELLEAEGCGLAYLDLTNNTKLTKDTVKLEYNVFMISSGKEIALSEIAGFDTSKASELHALAFEDGKIKIDGSDSVIGKDGVKQTSFSGGTYTYNMGNGLTNTFNIGLADYPTPRTLSVYISNITVENQMYTGEACEPTPTIVLSNIYKDNVTELDSECYTVSYRNNVEPGTATLIITGKYKYTGTKEATFKIIDGKVEMPFDSTNNAYLLGTADQLSMFAKIANGTAKAAEYKVVDSESEAVLNDITSKLAYFTADIDVEDGSVNLNKVCTIDMKGHKLLGKKENVGSAILIIANASEESIEIKNGTIEGNCGEDGHTSLLAVNSGKVKFTDCVFDYVNKTYNLTNAISNIAGDLTLTNCKVNLPAMFAIEMSGACSTSLNNCFVTNAYNSNKEVVLIDVLQGDLKINGGIYDTYGTSIYATGTKGAASVELNNAYFEMNGIVTGSSSAKTNICAWVPLKINDCEIWGGNSVIESSSDLTITGNTLVTATACYLDSNKKNLGSYALKVSRVASKTPTYNISGGKFTSINTVPYAIAIVTDSGATAISVKDLLGPGASYSVSVGDNDQSISGDVEIINENVHTINYVIPHGENSISNPKSFTSATPAITLSNPTADNGFTFVGWYTEASYTNKVTSLDTSVSNNYTLYAKYAADSFTIKLNANGGTGTMADITKSYEDATSGISIPSTFSREGYVFTGWSFKSDDEDPYFYGGNYVYLGTITDYIEKNSIASKTVTLYATWRSLTVDLSKAYVFFEDGVSSFEYAPGGVEPATIMVCAQDATSMDYVVLTKGVDYDITYENNNKLGNATAKIVAHTGNSNVTGETKIGFKITACALCDKAGNPNVYVRLNSSEPIVYNGAQQKPVIKVMLGGVELTRNTDYTISFSNNVNAAASSAAKAPTATIKGKGAYSGTVKFTFTINPQALDALVDLETFATINTVDSVVYTGKEIKPAVKLTYLSGTATKTIPTSAYTVTYTNNTNVSDTDPTITVTGKGNYSGTLTKKFAITGKSVAKLSVAVKSAKPVYSGSDTKLTNTVTVKDGKTVLVEGTDYEVHHIGDTTNVTTEGVKVYITGKGNYSPETSSKEKTYTIQPVKFTALQDNTYYKNDGAIHKPAVTLKDANGNVLSADLFDFEYSNSESKDAGNYKITIKPKTTSLNYTGKVEVKYSIGAKNSLEEGTITVPEADRNQTYTGKAIVVLPVVKMGDTTLVKDTDYTVSYKNNTNAGTATITVTGKGSYTGVLSSSFTIAPMDISSTATITVNENAVYASKALAAKVGVKLGKATLKAGKDYTVSYLDSAGNPIAGVPVNSGSYFVKVTGINNYATDASFKKAYSIAKKDVSKLSYSLPKGTKYVTDSSLLVLTVKDGKTVLTKDVDYTVSFGAIKNGKVEATITAVADSNYTNTVTKTFNISAEANAITLSATEKYIDMSESVAAGNIKTMLDVDSNSKEQTFTLSAVSGTAPKTEINITPAGAYSVPASFLGTLTVKISSGNGKDYKKASKTVKLIFVPEATTISSADVRNGKVNVSIKPENEDHATSYEIRYATNEKMSKPKTIKVTDLTKVGEDEIAATITGKVGTIYYIQARTAYKVGKTTYYSQWTSYNDGDPVIINR